MGRPATAVAIRPRDAAATGPYLALAIGCALLLAAGAVATAFVLTYCGSQLIDALGDGDGHTAAQWAAMSFAAAAPYIGAYAGWRGLAVARRGLAGDRPSIDVRRLAAPFAVVLGAVGLQAALSADSYFAGDDWVHLVLAGQVVDGPGLVSSHGLNIGYLDTVVFLHYAPGHRLAYWALERFAPLDWHLALAAMLVLFAGSLWLLHRICVQLFGERRSNLAVLAVFGTSIVLVRSFLWLADGLHKFPSTFLTLLAIYAWLRHRAERSRAALALSVAATSLGLLFYAKAILVPLYLALILLLFLERRPGRWGRALWEERWTWLAFAPTVAIYLWNYQLNYAHYAGDKPPVSELLHYLASVWFRVLVPALGGIRPDLEPGALPLLGALVTQVVLVGMVVVSVKRKRSAWRAWLFALIVFVANDVLIGLGRLESLGFHRTTGDMRYQTELMWLLPLAIAFAFYPSDVADGGAAAPARAPLLSRRRLRVAALGGLACFLVAAIVTGALFADDWITHKTNPPKAYVRALRDDGSRPLTVLGYERPPFVVNGEEGPWAQPRLLVPTLAPHVHFALASSRALAVRGDGHIRPARVQPLLGHDNRLDIAGTAHAVHGTVTRRGRATCLSAGAGAGTIEFEGHAPPFGPNLYGSFAFDVVHGSRHPATLTTPSRWIVPSSFPLDRRTASVVAELGDTMRIQTPPHTEVCVRSVDVGWLQT